MDNKTPGLSENLEDYLETIAALSSENGSARITDIANAMSVKKPSATSALNTLAEKGLVEYEKYRPVVLTKEGRKRAQNVLRKHRLLKGFLVGVLGVPEASANMAACRMEHALEDPIMEKLVGFLKSNGSNSCSECASRGGDCFGSCPHAMPLSELAVGDRAIVLSVGAGVGKLKGANAEIARESVVEILRSAPFGDPVIVRVKDSEISLRKAQLEKISVKRI